MTPTETMILRGWLTSHASLGEVLRAQRLGLLGNERFNERTRDWFVLLWTWSAPRFGSIAGQLQDRYYNRCGKAAYERRIARCQKLIQRIQS